MRLLLMGTGAFAVPTFAELAETKGDEIVAVVTKPLVGDPRRVVETPVAAWASTKGLRLWRPESLRTPESLEHLRQFQVDLAVVCDYGQILTTAALETPRLGAINLHGSLLPRHRGAAPVQWSILLGDNTSGVSVIRMTAGLDSGPVVEDYETDILPRENAQELETRLSHLGISVVLRALDRIRLCADREAFYALGQPQDSTAATKAPRLRKEDGRLDFRLNAAVVDRHIRGLQPWPGAYSELRMEGDKLLRVAVRRALPLCISPSAEDGGLDPPPGTLIARKTPAAAIELAVRCGDGWLAVQEIQPAGKRPMTAAEFAAGYCRGRSLRFEPPPHSGIIS